MLKSVVTSNPEFRLEKTGEGNEDAPVFAIRKYGDTGVYEMLFTRRAEDSEDRNDDMLVSVMVRTSREAHNIADAAERLRQFLAARENEEATRVGTDQR